MSGNRTDHYFTLILLVLTALFLSCATIYNLATVAPDAPHGPLDEGAHISYALHLIQEHRWWPDFNHFPFYVPVSDRTLNYLNHPPTFYWLTKLITFITGPLTLWGYRSISLLFTFASMAVYAAIGMRRAKTPATLLIYILLPFMLYIYFQIGYYNNDAAALLGGMIAIYASINWFEGRHPRRAARIMLLGLALASVKLTALMLVGGYVAASLLLHTPQRRLLPKCDWIAIAIACTVVVIPYAIFMVQWGSPAPLTPGQVEQLTQPVIAGKPAAGMVWTYLPKIGWTEAPLLDHAHWLAQFIFNFAAQTIGDCNFIPLLLIPFCFLLQFITTRGLTREAQGTDGRIARACMLATIPTLFIHMVFSWGRYRDHGWMIDSFVRYYFPLLPAYGLMIMDAYGKLSGQKRGA